MVRPPVEPSLSPVEATIRTRWLTAGRRRGLSPAPLTAREHTSGARNQFVHYAPQLLAAALEVFVARFDLLGRAELVFVKRQMLALKRLRHPRRPIVRQPFTVDLDVLNFTGRPLGQVVFGNFD